MAENRLPGTPPPPPLPNQSGSAQDDDIDIIDQIVIPPTPQPNRITGLDGSRYHFEFTSPNHLSRLPPIQKQSFHLNQGGDPIRKRPLDRAEDQSNKRTSLSQIGNTPGPLILEARDLLVKAAGLAKSHDEQSRILDLLEIFRDYTEKGKVYTTSKIIASQVANLESTTRKIESKTKELAKATIKPPTIAQIASIDLEPTTNTATPQEWTLVEKKKN
ncbi:hypothetical protein G7Y89_g8456 [Cudoniella acicularis]|uniref:Uncharacterized protein n=1 Tax=Cudoniella acicularis TaxID=354080 RepID=A0A8H4RGL1_9HELO|nr:hypothetical protein G7Y89_g8456 [Cudoniella acicularis]